MTIARARAGDRYQFRLDEDEYLYPDPESRFQPDGPHGASQLIDPAAFRWTDDQWAGADARRLVIYEMHIGSFTREGTWQSARTQLPELASIGITMLEIMPIAEFSGARGWGYDGVDLFAPSHLYGLPGDAKTFIDEAHRLGIAVILDVVYNHFGPDGNYLKAFADQYFTAKYENDWGDSIDFSTQPVRDFYLRNAAYWIEEFHFDGLRLDATQNIYDYESKEHIIAALTKHVRAVAGKRQVYVVAENEPQQSWTVRPPSQGGHGLDALWNDDFHHSAVVAMTGRTEAYYTDYRGAPQEFVSAAKYGYLYQGQRYKWQKKRRGSPALDLRPWNFVAYLMNHDQVANSARGDRLNTISNPALYRAMSALLMLAPATPMLFQGQEFGATTPFLFFCDHQGELSHLVAAGRRKFLSQFRSLAQPEMQHELEDPGNENAFQQSKLNFGERITNAPVYNLYKDLLRLRREDPVFSEPQYRGVDGAVLSSHSFLLRYFSPEHGDRLLIVNMGRDLALDPAPEPLLAPPRDHLWRVLWSSEHPTYGGTGTHPPDTKENWYVAANSALVLVPDPIEENPK